MFTPSCSEHAPALCIEPRWTDKAIFVGSITQMFTEEREKTPTGG